MKDLEYIGERVDILEIAMKGVDMENSRYNTDIKTKRYLRIY